MKFNLGAGSDLRQNWVNVDKTMPPDADISSTHFSEDPDSYQIAYVSNIGDRSFTLPVRLELWDLDEHPWPVKDNTATRIDAHHVLEHLRKPLSFFDEAHRVLRPNGRLHVRVPYAGSPNDQDDPTHRWSYTDESFRYLTHDAPYRYTDETWEIRSLTVNHRYRWPWGWHLDHYLGIPPQGQPWEVSAVLEPR